MRPPGNVIADTLRETTAGDEPLIEVYGPLDLACLILEDLTDAGWTLVPTSIVKDQ